MLNRRLTRAAAAVAAATVLSVWSPQLGYELGLSASNRAEAAPFVTPSNFKVDVGSSKLFAYWTSNSDNTTGYRVTYTPFGGTAMNVNVPGTANSALLTGLNNGTYYSVSVVAVYADGTSGAASSSATPGTGIPSAVTNLAADPVLQDSKVTLNWSLPTDGTRKRIDVYRDGSLRATLSQTDTSFSEAGLTNYTAYQYQVFAVNTTTLLGLTNLYRSDPSTVTVKPIDLTPPAAPQGVTSIPTDKAVGLSWDSNGETDFDHYSVTGPSGTVDVSTPAYTATGLSNGTTYSFTVYAVDKHNNRSAGTVVTGKPVDNVAPDVPTSLAVTAADSSLDATWTKSAATDTAGYKVYVDGGYKLTVPAGTTSAHIPGLVNGTAYRVQVSAVDGIPNESGLTASVYGTPVDKTAPSAPTGLVGTAGDTFATFAWNASPESDVDRYELRNSSGTTVASVASSVRTAAVTGLTNGTTSSFTVVAIDKAGNVSAASNTAAVTPRDTTPPAAPTNLVGTAGDTTASLSWTASADSDVDHYSVRDGAGTVLATVPVGTATANLTGLANDAALSLTVVAVDTAGNVSAASNTITMRPHDTTPPPAPTNLTALPGDTTAKLTWSASSAIDLDHYLVRDASGTTVATVPGGTTLATLTGLVDDTTYTYTVVAVDRSGNISSASNSVSVIPRDTTPPSVPTNFTGVAGDTTATLSWTASPESDVDRYVVRNAAGVTVAAVGYNVTTTQISGLANNSAVSFTVVAVDRSGNVSGSSAVVTITPRDTTAPTAPTSLSAVAGDSRAQLTWIGSPESDVDHYVVRNAAGTTLASAPAATTTVSVTGLANDTAIALTVSAVDTSGNVSGTSNVVTVTPRDTTAPSAPTNLKAVAGDAQAVLSWTASPESDVDQYVVRRVDGSTVTTVAAGSTSANVTGLTNGTAAMFTVVAVDRSGNVSAASTSVSVTPHDTTAPSPPTGITGTAGESSATVSWTRSPEGDVDRYVVKDSAGTTVAIVSASGSSATITGLVDGTAYTYTVVAVDIAGNASAASSPVTVTPVDTTPPPAPSGVASSASAGQVTVTWEASSNPDVNHYEVVDQSGTIRATAPAGSTSATVTGLTNGTSYTFSVVAVDAAGNRSTAAAALTATPKAPISASTAVTATPGDTQVTIAWTAVVDARVDHYSVCTTGGSCSSVPAGSTSFVATGLINGTAYTFTVTSVDAAGNESAASAPVTATPQPAPLAAPQNLTGTVGAGTATLTWSAVAGAASYDLLQNGVAVQHLGTTTATVSGLTNGTSYGFSVRAVSAAGIAGTASAGITLTPNSGTSATTPAAGAGASSGTTQSRNGRFTVFGTAAQLEASDTNTAYELYVKDASTGSVSRLDASATGTDLGTSQIGISDDGRYVVAATSAARVTSDTNGLTDAYRLDRTTGTWQLVSVPATGAVAKTAGTELQKGTRVSSTGPSIAVSGDGNQVYFFSSRTDLVTGDTNGAIDLFRKDMTTGVVTRVDVDPKGAQIATGVVGPALDITPDGRYVLFVTKIQNNYALWRKDMTTGALTIAAGTGAWASVGTVNPVNNDVNDVSISDDGRYVAFSSNSSALTPGAGEYLAYRQDMTTGKIVRAGITTQKVNWEHGVQMDPTGRYVFFSTTANVGADTDLHTDWYRRDLGGTDVTPVMVTSQATGAPSAKKMGGAVTTAEYGMITVLSGDQVVVATMQALVAGDTNGKTDLYAKTLSTGAVGSAV